MKKNKEYKQPIAKIVELKSIVSLLAGTTGEGGGGETDPTTNSNQGTSSSKSSDTYWGDYE